ncbi:MAG: hypothetical protein RAK24_04865 [TACK group archaeon]|nr:hypothetical protein [TACK group archaeon]
MHLRWLIAIEVSAAERDAAVGEERKPELKLKGVFESVDETLSSHADVVDSFLVRLRAPVA